MTAEVVILTIRDPDYANDQVLDVIVDVKITSIDIDLGSSFDGPNHFWGDLGEVAAREWLADHRAEVAHLPIDSDVRVAVEDLCEQLEEHHRGRVS